MTLSAEKLDDNGRVTETRLLKGGFKSIAEARNYMRSIDGPRGWDYFGFVVKQGGRILYRD